MREDKDKMIEKLDAFLINIYKADISISKVINKCDKNKKEQKQKLGICTCINKK